MRWTWPGIAVIGAAVLGLSVGVHGLTSTPGPATPVTSDLAEPARSAPPTVVSPGGQNDQPAPSRDEADRLASVTAVRIPAIGYRAAVRSVGVDHRGWMALPPDPALLGWYRFGPTPGEPGSAVLAGHLDSTRYGVGPLVRLREVRVGDRILLTRADGMQDRFVVVEVRRYGRAALPPELFGREGRPKLRIITCAGRYDAAAGGYQRNLVVTAVPA